MKWISIYSLKLNDSPLFLDVAELLESLQELPDPRSKSLHAFRIAGLIEHYVGAHHWRGHLDKPVEVQNVFKLVNVYGYGLCKQIVMLMQFLLDHTDVPNRVLALTDESGEWSHVVNETWYEGQWHVFDPDLGLYFTDSSGEILSAERFSEGNDYQVHGHMGCRKWARHIPTLTDEMFRKIYRSAFKQREVFQMLDHRYPWKQDFMENYGLTTWYNSDSPTCFVPENCEVRLDTRGSGVVDGERVPSPPDIDMDNLIFRFPDNRETFSLNNFPLPAIELRVFQPDGAGSSEGTLCVRGRTYSVSLGSGVPLLSQALEQNPELFQLPIYGLAVTSSQDLGVVELTTQSSSARRRIQDYLKDSSDLQSVRVQEIAAGN